MCGLAGILLPAQGSGTQDDVRRMATALAHRGPDDEGFFADGPIALAHRRLAIVDLSPAGHQPIADASGRYTMVYNGEIYNHRTLREQFLAGHCFRGSSDSETLIELFARRGPEALAQLNGIFAAAIWDRRERTLTLVRDGAGVKPLYVWTLPDGGIAFASELKALTALPRFAGSLDPVAAGAYLTYLWSPGERTMFTEVRKFPAGVWRKYDCTGTPCAEGRFYRLPDPDPRPQDDAAAIAATGRELGAAVERQLLADVEVGAFLSGGLDSSAIVHFARQHAGPGMNCFTLAYDEAYADREMVADLPYARRAAAHLGVRLHEVPIAPDIARDLPLLVEMLDEPQADPAAMGNFFISRAARAMGIKVLLSGAGGDDVFTGYRRHQQFALDRAIGLLPGAVRSGALHALTASGIGGGRGRRLAKLLGAMQGSADARLLRAFEWLARERASDLIAAHPGGDAICAPLREALAELPGASAVERLLRLDQQFFLRDHNLNYVDKTGMAAGVEIRVPFLDPELMAFASQLPPRAKLRGRTTKWVLRKAMEPHLPREVIYRPKTGFGVPLRAWLKGPLRELVGDLTSRATVDRRGLFDPVAVAALRDDHYAGRIDAAYPLLGVAMIELWCARFAGSAGAAPGESKQLAAALGR